mmetsp:Transcript_30105/g.47180  ORF Transcript_30105/g.47180 Transcript_30105/m.47180 type:complete len:146 (-) Transcript_30105:106-543(-)
MRFAASQSQILILKPLIFQARQSRSSSDLLSFGDEDADDPHLPKLIGFHANFFIVNPTTLASRSSSTSVPHLLDSPASQLTLSRSADHDLRLLSADLCNLLPRHVSTCSDFHPLILSDSQTLIPSTHQQLTFSEELNHHSAIPSL